MTFKLPKKSSDSTAKASKFRNEILKLWNQQDSSNNILLSQDLELLFDLYDNIAFYGQIREKISTISDKGMPVSLLFMEDLISPDITRICGIQILKEKSLTIINFNISEWAVTRIKYLYEEEDQLYNILLLFEHQLVHLLTILYLKEDEYIENSFGKPNVHGELFQSSEKTFFEHNTKSISFIDILEVISSKNTYPQPSSSIGRYKYKENSCYIDSLTTVLYFSISTKFRDAIFLTNVDVIDYKINNKFTSKCESDSGLIYEEQFRNLARKFQTAAFSDYMNLISGSSMTCYNLRMILSECYTSMID